MNVMVEDLNTIAHQECRTICVEANAMDMLLFQLLQELIYYKDADRLLLRVPEVCIERQKDDFELNAEACGEKLNPGKHELLAGVKAVTLHRFHVEQISRGWRSTVILDI